MKFLLIEMCRGLVFFIIVGRRSVWYLDLIRACRRNSIRWNMCFRYSFWRTWSKNRSCGLFRCICLSFNRWHIWWCFFVMLALLDIGHLIFVWWLFLVFIGFLICRFRLYFSWKFSVFVLAGIVCLLRVGWSVLGTSGFRLVFSCYNCKNLIKTQIEHAW